MKTSLNLITLLLLASIHSQLFSQARTTDLILDNDIKLAFEDVNDLTSSWIKRKTDGHLLLRSHQAFDIWMKGNNAFTIQNGNSTDVIRFKPNGDSWFKTGGNLGIGVTPTTKLTVDGTVTAEEVIVETVGADHVFEQDYRLRPLKEVAEYIEDHGHLPDVPSAEMMQENGLPLGDFNTLLLQKIEELTLYILKQDQEIKELKAQLK